MSLQIPYRMKHLWQYSDICMQNERRADILQTMMKRICGTFLSNTSKIHIKGERREHSYSACLLTRHGLWLVCSWIKPPISSNKHHSVSSIKSILQALIRAYTLIQVTCTAKLSPTFLTCHSTTCATRPGAVCDKRWCQFWNIFLQWSQ